MLKRCNLGVKKYQAVTKNSFILTFLQSFECSCSNFQTITFSVNHKKVHFYQGKNTVTKNNKMQLIIDIIQLYYALPNKNNGLELMLLFNIGLSRLINRLSVISNKNFLVA